MTLIKCMAAGCSNSREEGDTSGGKPLLYRCASCGDTYCSMHTDHGRRSFPCPSCGQPALHDMNPSALAAWRNRYGR
jgi:DNA-directed RNA polymerase subunit RPC12/RpoP